MRILAAIPVFNEERHLPRVLKAVREQISDILVVDDGSTDATPRLLAANSDGLHTIRHARNQGYGQSLIDAFAFASAQGFDWVITLDCDEQHEPAWIPRFVTATRASGADIISGTRYLVDHPEDSEAPEDRRRINGIITRLLRCSLHLPLTDSFCGFKAYRVGALQRLRLTEPGYAFPIQFWVQCAARQLNIIELPVPRIYRDMTRTFGGVLDDAELRLQHYLDVMATALSDAGLSRLEHCVRSRPAAQLLVG